MKFAMKYPELYLKIPQWNAVGICWKSQWNAQGYIWKTAMKAAEYWMKSCNEMHWVCNEKSQWNVQGM